MVLIYQLQLYLYWVLEYYTLILFLVLGSYSSYLYLKSIYFFSGSTPKLSISVRINKEALKGFISGVSAVIVGY